MVANDFEQAYLQHFPAVHRFVLRLVPDPALAEELTQDAFLRAYQARGQFRGDAPERRWLLRIARNVALDYLRSPRARDASVAALEDDGETKGTEAPIASGQPEPDVEQAVRRGQMSECVRDFVQTLPETLRRPLLLHDVEGLTNVEVARALGCSLEAAKMRLHRARARLRAMMEANCDLFHDEENVLSCLPVGPQPLPLLEKAPPRR